MVETRKTRMWPQAIVLSALLLVMSGRARGAETGSAAAVPFPVSSVQLEQNATDGDVEVLFEIKGGDDGLTELVVVSPDGRRVVDFKAPGSSAFGMRQFRFETPEPSDVASLKAAYPEGVYEFYGKDSSGTQFAGKSTLSHRLPATAALANPVPGAENVPVKDLEISWSVVEGVEFYIVEIEQDELSVNITARLSRSSTSFAVPDGFLVPGKEFTVLVGTVSGEGNTSFVETTFTTKE